MLFSKQCFHCLHHKTRLHAQILYHIDTHTYRCFVSYIVSTCNIVTETSLQFIGNIHPNPTLHQHTHTHTHTHIYIYIYIYIYTYIYIYIYVYIYSFLNMYEKSHIVVLTLGGCCLWNVYIHIYIYCGFEIQRNNLLYQEHKVPFGTRIATTSFQFCETCIYIPIPNLNPKYYGQLPICNNISTGQVYRNKETRYFHIVTEINGDVRKIRPGFDGHHGYIFPIHGKHLSES